MYLSSRWTSRALFKVVHTYKCSRSSELSLICLISNSGSATIGEVLDSNRLKRETCCDAVLKCSQVHNHKIVRDGEIHMFFLIFVTIYLFPWRCSYLRMSLEIYLYSLLFRNSAFYVHPILYTYAPPSSPFIRRRFSCSHFLYFFSLHKVNSTAFKGNLVNFW